MAVRQRGFRFPRVEARHSGGFGENTMRIPLYTSVASIAIASGLVASAATATTIQGVSMWPGSICQLSIPTTNTGVRPKATGFRNESTTTSNFVICPISNAVGVSNDNDIAGVLRLYSMDGATHNVSCTAVSGWDKTDLHYSTKTFSVSSADPSYGYTAQWTATDFGGTDGDPIPGSIGFSVTCNLPPQVAIAHAAGVFNYEIGS
jgi:hypothetical protein